MDNQLLLQLLLNKTSEIQNLLEHFKSHPNDLEKGHPLLSDRIQGLVKDFKLIQEGFSEMEVDLDCKSKGVEQHLNVEAKKIVEVKEDVEESNKRLESSTCSNGNNETESTLNDQLQSNSADVIGEKLSPKKLTDIRSGIGINDRFLFIRELFDSDVEEYNQAIDLVNSSEQFETVQEHFELNMNWDFEDSTVIQFIEIVKRKF